MTTVVELSQVPKHDDESVLLYHEDFTDGIIKEDSHAKKDSSQFQWKANTYKFTFNVYLFIQALFVNAFYLFGLGLLIEALKLLTQWKKLHNLSSGISLLSRQLKLVILFVFPLFLFWSLENATSKKSTIQAIAKKIVFIVIYYSSLLAHSNKRFPSLLSLVKLPAENFQSMYSPLESTQQMKDELQSTIQRLKVDISYLYFNFLQEKVDVSHLKKSQIGKVDGGDDPQLKYEGGKVLKQASKTNIVETSREFEKKIFEKNYLSHENRLDEQSLFGYNLAVHHLQKAIELHSPSTMRPVLIGLINFIHPIFVTVVFNNSNFGDIDSILYTIVFMFLGFWFAVWIIQIIEHGLANIKRRLYLMEQLKHLILVNKLQPANTQQPNLNIFDPMSLRTWSSVRKIYMSFDERSMQAIGTALVFILFMHGLMVILFLVESFHIYKFFGQSFYLSLAIYTPACFIYLGYFVALAYYGYQINNHHEHHDTVLKKNMLAIQTLFQLYPHLVGENPIKPKTYLYGMGLKQLKAFVEKEQHAEGHHHGEEHIEEMLEEKMESIVGTYEHILSELELEDKKSPFRLMGFPNRKKFFKMSILCLLPLIISIINTQLPEGFFEMLPKYIKFIL